MESADDQEYKVSRKATEECTHRAHAEGLINHRRKMFFEVTQNEMSRHGQVPNWRLL